MKKVERNELLGLGAYEEIRERWRARIIELKGMRRLAVGNHMTVLWENHDTVLYQIQEMIRTERITNESAIAHEIETYNTLVPGDSELSATWFIEYAEPTERARMLDQLAGLGEHVALHVGPHIVPARFELQPGELETRLPAVNYVKFTLPDAARAAFANSEVKVVVSHPAYQAQAALPSAMLRTLREDWGHSPR